MITKKRMNWNLKFVILEFKYEYWDNTESNKNNKKGAGRVGKGAVMARIVTQSWYW